MNNTTSTELPISVKEQLLELSDRLPAAARSPFIKNTSRRIEQLASDYENTLIYAAVGWVLGEILDTVLTVPFLGSLTGDNASQIGMMVSGLLGFAKDRKKAKQLKEEQERVLTIIREELQASIQRVK